MINDCKYYLYWIFGIIVVVVVVVVEFVVSVGRRNWIGWMVIVIVGVGVGVVVIDWDFENYTNCCWYVCDYCGVVVSDLGSGFGGGGCVGCGGGGGGVIY